MEIMRPLQHSLSVLLILTAAAAATASYTPNDKSSVEWEKDLITATARYSAQTDSRGVPIDYSDPSAQSPTRAKMEAYTKAREAASELIAFTLRDVRIDGNTLIKDIIDQNSSMQEKLSFLLRDKVKTRETPDGFLAARSSASLKISQLISALPFDYPGESIPRSAYRPLATEYTSLIIDVRGRGIPPMIFPSIYDEDGLEIYGRRYVNITQACAHGLVSYAPDERSAKKHKLAGSHPYYTSALSALNGSPVISMTDARRILAHDKTVEKLKRCAVIFIIDTAGKKGTSE